MTQVSTQAELQTAIAAQETDIEVTADFKIDTQHRITYAATISSGAGGPYTLTTADGHNGALFLIENRGSLTLTNIILGAGDRTLYARQEVGFTVLYSGNDEGGPPAENVPPPQTVPVEEGAPLSEELPTREGYAFAGWNTDPFGGGTAYQPGDTIYVTGDLVLYAQWEAVQPTIHLITYEPNGLSVEGLPEQQEVPEGETVSLSAAVPTRAGYRFLNWNSQPDGTGAAYRPGQAVGPLYADLTLYAQWEAIPPTLHLLTYEPNDAGGPSAENIPEQEEVEEGNAADLSAAVPTRTGYRFLNWNSQPDGTGAAYRPGQTVGPLYADLTLYAQWVRLEHTLTYHGNDEGGPAARNVPAPQPIYEDQAVSLSDMIPTREGYLFTGWNTRPDGSGTSYQPGASFGPAATDADLYAQWAPMPPSCHTLIYCGNDAGGPPACCIPCPEWILAGQCARISCCSPCRTCCCFTGWNTDPCGSGQPFYPGQTIGPVTGDVRLYAQWRGLPPTKPCYICRRESD